MSWVSFHSFWHHDNDPQNSCNIAIDRESMYNKFVSFSRSDSCTRTAGIWKKQRYPIDNFSTVSHGEEQWATDVSSLRPPPAPFLTQFWSTCS